MVVFMYKNRYYLFEFNWKMSHEHEMYRTILLVIETAWQTNNSARKLLIKNNTNIVMERRTDGAAQITRSKSVRTLAAKPTKE